MENKNSTLNKRLKSYSAIAGTIVAAVNTADAQVVYTDVIPDAVVNTGGTYDLDLDNNGAADFQFQVTHGTYTYMSFPIQYDLGLILPVPSSGNAIDTLGGPVAHPISTSIGSSLAFEDDAGAGYQLLGLNAGFYQTGNFLGQTDKYLGLRFKIAGADHYGWVRIDFNAAGTVLTVKDYAYDATANTAILTGAMPTGINEHELASNVTVFSADNTIRVNMNNAKAEGMITVTNTLGQEVAKATVTGSQMSIPMDNAGSGIYFVTVMQSSTKFTKKVIIK